MSMEWEKQARWIWVPDFDDSIDPGQFVLFRKSLHLDQIPTRPCLLRISADTRYRFYVNGDSVSFGPCKSYPAKWYFEEVDISGFLRPGKNVFSANVLRFSSSHIGSFSMARAPFPGLICHCKLDDQILSSDSTWKAKKNLSIQLAKRSEWNYALGPPFLSLSEKVDNRLAETRWLDSDYNDSSWPFAEVRTAKLMMMPVLEPWRLNERPIPMLPEIWTTFDRALVAKGTSVTIEEWNNFLKVASSIVIPANTTSVVEIESSELTTGFLQLAVDAGDGAAIKIICAECYESDMSGGKSRHKSDRSDFKNGKLYGPEDTFITKAGTNYYEPFWFRTFRYIQLSITTTDSPLTLNSFSYRSTHYPLDISTTFSSCSSSESIDSLWTISLNTLKNCMHETYEDCPYYEQNQFAMDSRTMMLLTYNLSRDDRLARKTMHEFYASRRDDGLIETNFPVSARCTNIPQFSLYWIFMVEDHYAYFGDKALVKLYLGTIDGILEHFARHINEFGLVGRFDREAWPFIDWVPQWIGPGGLANMGIPNAYKIHGAATYNSLVYAMGLNSAAVLCEAVGRRDTAAEYRERANAMNEAVNKHCWDGSLYTDGPGVLESPGLQDRSQHAQIFAVLSGAVSGDDAKMLLRKTFRTVGLPKASFAILFYAFRAASKAGIYEELFEELVAPWKKMLECNVTTCLESMEGMYRSDCHGWSACLIYEMVGEVLGVTPCKGKGDKKRIRVQPRMDILEKAKGTVVTAQGHVTVGWNERKELRIYVDQDLEIELVLNGWSGNLKLIKDEEIIIRMPKISKTVLRLPNGNAETFMKHKVHGGREVVIGEKPIPNNQATMKTTTDSKNELKETLEMEPIAGKVELVIGEKGRPTEEVYELTKDIRTLVF